MAISRNMRRLRAKVRQAIASTDASNTAKFLAKSATLRGNMRELGKRANSRPDVSRGLTMDYCPSHKPLGFTRPLRWSKGVAE